MFDHHHGGAVAPCFPCNLQTLVRISLPPRNRKWRKELMSWSGQKCIQKIFIRCRNERNWMKGQKTRFVFRRIGNSAVTFHRMWHFIERRLIDRSSQVDLKSRLIYSRVLVIFLGFNLLTRLSNVCVFFNGSILASFSLFSSYLYYTIDR